MKTMRIISLTVCLILIAFSLSGKTKKIKEVRETGSFTAINGSSGVDIYFTQDKIQKVEVEAEKSILEKVIVKVEKDVLLIERKDKNNPAHHNESNHVRVYITAPTITVLNLKEGADFESKSLNCNGDFSIGLLSGGGIEINNLTISGNIVITAERGADCTINKLKCNNCEITASGGADIEIEMESSGNLNLIASGSSDVELKGVTKKASITKGAGVDIDIASLKYEDIEWK